nr:hypothetical protein [Salinisphaera sp. Q1T1-3]
MTRYACYASSCRPLSISGRAWRGLARNINRPYDVIGARASANRDGFDIYWRNLRTHSLQDPVAYKRVEVGRFALLDEVPEPTWYT